MTLQRQLLTSENQVIDIMSDDERVIDHFNNPANYADIVLNQINTDRLYDPMFEGKDNLIILDIGGNIGLFTLYAQDKAKAIYPIEPTPNHFYILTELTKDYSNIHPINVALNNTDTIIDFYINPENSTMNSLANQYGLKTPVQAKTLSTIINDLNLDHVDFVKCDIEGSEMIAITKETIEPVKDIIDSWFFEIHNTSRIAWPGNLEDNRDDIKNILENAGYDVQILRFDALYAVKNKGYSCIQQ